MVLQYFRSNPGRAQHNRAETMLEIVERFRFVKQSGVDVETLCYLLKHEIAPESNVHLDEKQLKKLADAARDAVRSIPDVPVKTQPITQTEKDEAEKAIRLFRLNREEAAIASLATGLGGAREIVDELLRKRLRDPLVPTEWGIYALLAPAFLTSTVSHSPTAAVPPDATLDPAFKAKVDAADKAVEDILVRLHKILLICNALKLSPADLRLVRASET